MGNMGEIATLTDKLALMPDNQLPRLAQQYKGDAITLSLILGEKNRRDRLRNAPKAAAMNPQPKVNDAVVASMQLPEETGIGALPAPNMANMADGGITGYDMNPDNDGGLAYANEPVLRMADGGNAFYDGSFYNVGVNYTATDIGTGSERPALAGQRAGGRPAAVRAVGAGDRTRLAAAAGRADRRAPHRPQ